MTNGGADPTSQAGDIWISWGGPKFIKVRDLANVLQTIVSVAG
jgi:hypothetical protein